MTKKEITIIKKLSNNIFNDLTRKLKNVIKVSENLIKTLRNDYAKTIFYDKLKYEILKDNTKDLSSITGISFKDSYNAVEKQYTKANNAIYDLVYNLNAGTLTRIITLENTKETIEQDIKHLQDLVNELMAFESIT